MSITKLALMLVCLMSAALAMERCKREAHGKVVRLVLASQVALVPGPYRKFHVPYGGCHSPTRAAKVKQLGTA